jgi:hypothetical protein
MDATGDGSEMTVDVRAYLHLVENCCHSVDDALDHDQYDVAQQLIAELLTDLANLAEADGQDSFAYYDMELANALYDQTGCYTIGGCGECCNCNPEGY